MCMRELLPILTVLVLTWALGACGDDDDGATLDPSHEGWENPGCFGAGCHDETTTHHSELFNR